MPSKNFTPKVTPKKRLVIRTTGLFFSSLLPPELAQPSDLANMKFQLLLMGSLAKVRCVPHSLAAVNSFSRVAHNITFESCLARLAKPTALPVTWTLPIIKFDIGVKWPESRS